MRHERARVQIRADVANRLRVCATWQVQHQFGAGQGQRTGKFETRETHTHRGFRIRLRKTDQNEICHILIWLEDDAVGARTFGQVLQVKVHTTIESGATNLDLEFDCCGLARRNVRDADEAHGRTLRFGAGQVLQRATAGIQQDCARHDEHGLQQRLVFEAVMVHGLPSSFVRVLNTRWRDLVIMKITILFLSFGLDIGKRDGTANPSLKTARARPQPSRGCHWISTKSSKERRRLTP